MRRDDKRVRDERGATLLEFAIGASVFLTAMFGIIEFSRLLWVHNALADAARRGARFAVTQKATDAGAVANMVVYGNPAGGTQPVVNDLRTSQVKVTYSNFGLNAGTATVTITDYSFQFVVPLFATKVLMPDYRTTLTGENAGLVPPNV